MLILPDFVDKSCKEPTQFTFSHLIYISTIHLCTKVFRNILKQYEIQQHPALSLQKKKASYLPFPRQEALIQNSASVPLRLPFTDCFFFVFRRSFLLNLRRYFYALIYFDSDNESRFNNFSRNINSIHQSIQDYSALR